MNVHVLYRGPLARPVPAFSFQLAVTVALLAFARPAQSPGPFAALLWFAAGLGGWTLFEYFLHRSLMHSKNRFLWELLHQEHHRTRQMADPNHRVLHPFVSTAVFTLAFVGLVRGLGLPMPAWVGLWVGYVAYEALHFMQHDGRLARLALRSAWARHLVETHADHHFRDVHANYGISTVFWDHVFGTYLAPEVDAAARA